MMDKPQHLFGAHGGQWNLGKLQNKYYHLNKVSSTSLGVLLTFFTRINEVLCGKNPGLNHMLFSLHTMHLFTIIVPPHTIITEK